MMRPKPRIAYAYESVKLRKRLISNDVFDRLFGHILLRSVRKNGRDVC